MVLVASSQAAFAAGSIQGQADAFYATIFGIISGAFGIGIAILCFQALSGRKGWPEVISGIGLCFIGMAGMGIAAYAKTQGSGTFTG